LNSLSTTDLIKKMFVDGDSIYTLLNRENTINSLYDHAIWVYNSTSHDFQQLAGVDYTVITMNDFTMGSEDMIFYAGMKVSNSAMYYGRT